MFDLLFSGGTVIDGTASPGVLADVAVRGDRIAAIGNLGDAQAGQAIDCRGKVVTPGFVDVHNHSDGWMLVEPHLKYKTSQGFATEVLMADGISYAPVSEHNWRQWIHYLRSLNGLSLANYRGWRSLADYMALLDGRNVQNTAMHVPYANVRVLACGFGRTAPPDDFQMREIQAHIRQGMEEGAVGLSTGLDYVAQCHATTDELVAACSAIAEYDGLYVTHVRYKLGLLPALREAVEIGRRAGVRVHISHLKASSLEEAEEVLTFLDRVARSTVDISFDAYPYQRGSTMLNYLLPYEVWQDGPLGVLAKLDEPDVRQRFAAGLAAMAVPLDQITIAWTAAPGGDALAGMPLDEFVGQQGKPAHEALIDLLIDSNLATLLVLGSPEDQLIEPILKHELGMLGTDGIWMPVGHVHPRAFGSVPRWLGPLVRERKLFSLETAVHKMSGQPAARFRLPDRGVLREGAFADVCVFDPQAVEDAATYAEPRHAGTGVEWLAINGKLVVRNGTAASDLDTPLPGRFVRRNSDGKAA